MQKLILTFILIISAVFSSKPYVLMVSFDGLRYDYLDWVDTPNFDFIQKKGVKSKGLIPVFPSLTFPNHYSIATGAYSGKHNITGNSFYDKKLNQHYSLYDKNSVRNPKFYKSEPIWVTAERQGVKSASFFWVGTEAPIKGISPSIYKYYNGEVPFKSRIDSVVSWFELDENERPQLILLYFSEPDYTGHKFGIDKNKLSISISKMDSLLGYLYSELKKTNIFNQLNIIITSDHGMTDVSKDRLIILDDYITDLSNLIIRGSGSHVQIEHIDNDFLYSKLLYSELLNIPNSRAWKKLDIPKRFQFVNRNTGHYLLLANEGWFITTSSDLNKKDFKLAGMHGYDPKYKNMHGIFYATGKNIKSNLVIESFENIHVYPLICKLLNINPYNNAIDGPDGNLDILNHIVK